MKQINRIYGGVEAETRKSQLVFRLLVLCEACRAQDLDNLKTSLGFPCRGLKPTIDYFSHPLYL